MNYLTILIIAIGLSFDTFAVSVSSGLKDNKLRFFDAFKIAFSLAFFQAAMPVIGWLAGSSVKDIFADFDHWVAFGLLFLVGLKMIIDSIKTEKKEKTKNPLHIPTLVLMSLATSIDALVVGFSFAILEIRILLAAAMIGIITGIVAMLGMLFGKNAGKHLGRKAEVSGGLILIAIGIKILFSHLYSL